MQVNIGLRVLTRPIPSKLPELYRTLGTNYDERVLPSIIQASHPSSSPLQCGNNLHCDVDDDPLIAVCRCFERLVK